MNTPNDPSTVLVSVKRLTPLPGVNPNSMSDEDYKSLVDVIRSGSFRQPILARQSPTDPGSYEIIDGVHRTRAQTEIDENAMIPAVIIVANDAQARAARLSMNRLRGSINLSTAAAEIAWLAQQGWGLDQLSMTGFSETEVSDLIRATSTDPDEVMRGGSSLPDMTDEEDVRVERPFVLELRFTTRDELTKAKRHLRKASGQKGAKADLARGLMRLIEGA
jgi:ParB/RepB/Spo0J family partition protein